MFTGIIEAKAKVLSFTEGVEGWHLLIHAPSILDGLNIGDSVAVNGCCLTVTKIEGDQLSFDILEQTIRVTSFRQIKEGLHVNVERAMLAGGRFGGHWVSGHVDDVGVVNVFEQRGKNFYLNVSISGCKEDYRKYLIDKGSITIDGISLTLAEVGDDYFVCWLIPHTLEITQLGERVAGDVVNLEFDVLAKYVEKMMSLKGKTYCFLTLSLPLNV